MRHGLRSVCQLRPDDVTSTNSEVTGESITALTQYCQLLFDVTFTSTEVTEESTTAGLSAELDLGQAGGCTAAPGMGRRRRSPGRSGRRSRTRASRPWLSVPVTVRRHLDNAEVTDVRASRPWLSIAAPVRHHLHQHGGRGREQPGGAGLSPLPTPPPRSLVANTAVTEEGITAWAQVCRYRPTSPRPARRFRT